MTAFRFLYGPAVMAGAGSSRRIADLVAADRLLLVIDRQIMRLGLAEPCLTALAKAGKEVVVFQDVEADPSRSTLEAVVAQGRDAAVGGVLGFGGGSPMDVAKLAAYLIGSGDDLDAIWGVGKACGPRLPLILVPRTAGTGSEATPVSIITLGKGEKRGVSSAALIADHAVLDADLTLGLPPAVTAATGIDAIVHAIEAYASRHLKNPLSDTLAREALRLLTANVPAVMTHPGDGEARAAMMLGAHLAGVAFSNAPVAGVHALAYPLGGLFHVPHGLSNALMLPHVLRFNMAAALPLYAELAPIADAHLAGLDSDRRATGLVDMLARLSVESGLPTRLADVGVQAGDLDRLADDAMLQERLLRNNPRAIERDDARRLYEAAL